MPYVFSVELFYEVSSNRLRRRKYRIVSTLILWKLKWSMTRGYFIDWEMRKINIDVLVAFVKKFSFRFWKKKIFQTSVQRWRWLIKERETERGWRIFALSKDFKEVRDENVCGNSRCKRTGTYIMWSVFRHRYIVGHILIVDVGRKLLF